MYSIFPKENVFQSTKVYLKRNEFTSSPKENEFQNWIHPGYKGFPQIKCIPQNRMYSKYKAFLESKCIRVQEFSSKDMSLGYMKFPQKRMYSEYKSFPRKKMYQGTRVFLKRECIRSTRVFLERKCIHRRGHGFVTESEDGAFSPPDEKKLSTCG